jgi:hypothetical protein
VAVFVASTKNTWEEGNLNMYHSPVSPVERAGCEYVLRQNAGMDELESDLWLAAAAHANEAEHFLLAVVLISEEELIQLLQLLTASEKVLRGKWAAGQRWQRRRPRGGSYIDQSALVEEVVASHISPSWDRAFLLMEVHGKGLALNVMY